MEGEIVDIGIRSTMLRLDNDMIHVPNNILFNGVVGVKPVSKIMWGLFKNSNGSLEFLDLKEGVTEGFLM